jgi:hypothetical protein
LKLRWRKDLPKNDRLFDVVIQTEDSGCLGREIQVPPSPGGIATRDHKDHKRENNRTKKVFRCRIYAATGSP